MLARPEYHAEDGDVVLRAALRDQAGALVRERPTMAYQTIDRYLPYELIGESGALDISFIESRLESYPGKLSAVAEDLDNLRRYHRQTLQDLPVGIFTLNGSGKITLWNKAMETLTGIKGQQVSDNFPRQLPAPWASFLQEFIDDDQTSFLPKKTLQLAGQIHWLNLHKAKIEESPAEGLIIVLEDLTETQLLERELIHSERLASIGSLAAGVAHEIGNPVTAIACLAQNMRDEATNEDQRLMAEKIIDQTRRTSRIVQSLVEFAHAGDKNHISAAHELEACDLKSVIDQAVDLVRLASESVPVQFLNMCASGRTLQVNRQRFQQVFVNLLTNARDASPKGGDIRITEVSTDKEVILCVEDSGNGIPEEIQLRVFEPFFTTKDPGKGTGLGLSMVFNILEDMGGKIRLLSPADEVNRTGTKVFVTFPG
jgi:PAS domain S-box-containing protein